VGSLFFALHSEKNRVGTILCFFGVFPLPKNCKIQHQHDFLIVLSSFDLCKIFLSQRSVEMVVAGKWSRKIKPTPRSQLTMSGKTLYTHVPLVPVPVPRLMMIIVILATILPRSVA
jgi:hypothetical protein